MFPFFQIFHIPLQSSFYFFFSSSSPLSSRLFFRSFYIILIHIEPVPYIRLTKKHQRCLFRLFSLLKTNKQTNKHLFQDCERRKKRSRFIHTLTHVRHDSLCFSRDIVLCFSRTVPSLVNFIYISVLLVSNNLRRMNFNCLPLE